MSEPKEARPREIGEALWHALLYRLVPARAALAWAHAVAEADGAAWARDLLERHRDLEDGSAPDDLREIPGDRPDPAVVDRLFFALASKAWTDRRIEGWPLTLAIRQSMKHRWRGDPEKERLLRDLYATYEDDREALFGDDRSRRLTKLSAEHAPFLAWLPEVLRDPWSAPAPPPRAPSPPKARAAGGRASAAAAARPSGAAKRPPPAPPRAPSDALLAKARRLARAADAPAELDLAWVDERGQGFGELWLLIGARPIFVAKASAYRLDEYSGAEDHRFVARLFAGPGGACRVALTSIRDVHYGGREESTARYLWRAGEATVARVEAPSEEGWALVGELVSG